MFRQIGVIPDHQNYQRIVWREHPSAPLKPYQLGTVTYGTACAPYLAVRVLEQRAYDHKEQYPTASKILLEDFYVDDLLTGSNNENELIAIRKELLELMSHAKMYNSLSEFDELVHRASSWQRLVHTVGYVLRFIQRLKEPRKRVESTILSFEEIKAAQIVCLRNAHACFGDDRRLIQKDQPLRNRSQLFKLTPCIGQDGLLRVGGRLRPSQLPEEVKHPILLPKAPHITKLILEHEHWVNLHPGTSALFVIVRQRYWIIGARNLIRKVTHNCIRCFRQRHHTTHQLMSDLPSIRITQSLPFVNSGCDYAGPITLKDRKGRNAKKSKGCICLFVCLVTSALHLELVTDLSTETFLAALRRFMSLKCNNSWHLHSIRIESRRHWQMKALNGSSFHRKHLTGEETQISAVVNSRPLYYTPDTDVTYLSPAHLLIGRSFTTIPEGDMSHIQENRLDYWQEVQALYQGFWKRWHQEYLTTLQHRPKWGTPQPNVELGSVVLIKDSNTPPAAWPLARVMSTHTGTDGRVRAVKLKTASGEATRAITKIAVLPNSETMFQGGPGC
ncbi:uncharacterized protein LOC123258305 [Drosophila ananassae]|uniref:uncharacterized protein LOC123258305 n=1 Tax=Drosophila ananassae TaxID=7217 RepID=UPI001CFF629A|nr:uncharacterized protein LOC123258305 [Drosophila ananassae]